MPRVSLIVPVFNTAPFLRECLESVLAQTFPDWELVCVDDGSTDDSPRILAEYSARDERIVVLRQSNSGQGAARNAGLGKARGEYVLFLDSDDLLDSGALSDLVKICDADRLDHLIFGARCFSSTPEADAERMAALEVPAVVMVRLVAFIVPPPVVMIPPELSLVVSMVESEMLTVVPSELLLLVVAEPP